MPLSLFAIVCDAVVAVTVASAIIYCLCATIFLLAEAPIQAMQLAANMTNKGFRKGSARLPGSDQTIEYHEGVIVVEFALNWTELLITSTY